MIDLMTAQLPRLVEDMTAFLLQNQMKKDVPMQNREVLALARDHLEQSNRAHGRLIEKLAQWFVAVKDFSIESVRDYLLQLDAVKTISGYESVIDTIVRMAWLESRRRRARAARGVEHWHCSCGHRNSSKTAANVKRFLIVFD